MSYWHHNPRIYEINTCVWLNTLSQVYNKPISLENVPSEILDELASYHVDAIWLMGVWYRGRITRQSALNYIHEYQGALPDVTKKDVAGSAYAIGAYDVEQAIGGREGLAIFRQQLHERGLKLILDFVPNHTGHDHPWLMQHPEYYVQGREEHKNKGFFEKKVGTKSHIIANGKDPYFDGWVDTAQLNAFSEEYRRATVRTLREMASMADGVRCDMAMLMMNDIFAKTWGWLGIQAPQEDFWSYIIPRVKELHPHFIFIGEIYWNLNYAMIQQGFDYTYDKVMYDRLLAGDVNGIKSHLLAERSFLEHQIRFIENHDEHRAAAAFGIDRSRPAAVLMNTVPGASLLHDGQFLGRKIKLPVQITRQPYERAYPALKDFYLNLLEEASDDIYRYGEWRLFPISAACEGCQGAENLIAYGWRQGDDIRLIVLNFSEHWSQAIVDITAWGDILHEQDWVLLDVMHRRYNEEQGETLAQTGFTVDLAAHQAMIYHFRPRAKRKRLIKVEVPTEAKRGQNGHHA